MQEVQPAFPEWARSTPKILLLRRALVNLSVCAKGISGHENRHGACSGCMPAGSTPLTTHPSLCQAAHKVRVRRRLYRPWEVLTDAPPSSSRPAPVRQDLPRPVLYRRCGAGAPSNPVFRAATAGSTRLPLVTPPDTASLRGRPRGRLGASSRRIFIIRGGGTAFMRGSTDRTPSGKLMRKRRSSAAISSLVRTRPSAGSGVLLCEGLGDEWAAVMVAQPLPKLLAGELAVGLDHGPLAVRPAGLDRVQPRALARQAADEEAAAAPDGLDPAVVGRDPGPHLAADVPGALSHTRARTRTPS